MLKPIMQVGSAIEKKDKVRLSKSTFFEIAPTRINVVFIQAGLAVIDEPFSMEDILKNHPIVSKALETQKPGWTPGKRITIILSIMAFN